jgi:6-pyruvoyltetrahydropterin/6-carboxytetrahydropterin synthase
LADELIKNGHKVILADYQPTIEEMVTDFAGRISSKLPSKIKLHCLKLEETETSYSEWFAADN